MGKICALREQVMWGLWPTERILAFTLNETSNHWRVLSQGATGAHLCLKRLL